MVKPRADITDESSLLFFLYGDHRVISFAEDYFAKAFQLTQGKPGFYCDGEGDIDLWRFHHPLMDDTSVLEMLIYLKNDLDWPYYRERLEKCLDEQKDSGIDLTLIWGSSLVYLCRKLKWKGDSNPPQDTFNQCKSLWNNPSIVPTPLAGSEWPKGKLWLLDIPLVDNHHIPTSTYLALGQLEPEEILLTEVFLGPKAAFLHPDIIAHKGYYIARQLAESIISDGYREKVHLLQKSAINLLVPDKSSNGKTRVKEEDDSLEQLAAEYDRLLGVVPSFSDLHIMVTRQVINFQRVVTPEKNNPVWDYHLSNLKIIQKELELKVAQGENALQTAGHAVEISRARMERREGQRQEMIQLLLAIAGLGFTVPQLVDRSVTLALAQRLGMCICESQILTVTGLQIAVVGIVMALGAGMIKIIQKIVRGR